MPAEFVICICNDNYAASLERGKVYRLFPDLEASIHNLIRIIDESGEDFLYPGEYFAAIDPTSDEKTIEAKATRGSRQEFERALNKVKNVPADTADKVSTD